MSDTSDLENLTPEKVENIQTEAKRTFSLGNRLRGIKPKVKKQLVFTDSEALEAYQDAEVHLQRVGNVVDGLRRDGDKPEALELKEAEYETLKAVSDDRKAELLEGALSIHLAAIPDAAVDRCRREARKGATGPDKQLDQEVFNPLFTKNLMNLAIVKVVDSSGAEAELAPDENYYDLLRGVLPTSQWTILDTSMSALLFMDSIGSLATEDAGF